MSLEAFYDEIRRFLVSKDAEVLVISGKWGVGKTFAWNKLLTEARDSNIIGLEYYAYVSLFGLSGLEDVKSAIFQNTVPSDKAGTPADMKTLSGIAKSAAASWRSGFDIAKIVPGLTDYSAALGKIGFFSVRDQIVCLDDLERKSGSLDMRDILGLISFLREQRRCKIAILLNDEKLAKDDEEYRTQLEKVADATVRFEPLPAESAEIGIDPSTTFHEKLHQHCIDLGIVNIRTIKKIERIAKRLEDNLEGFDRRVIDQAIHSAALFIFSKHQPDVAPSLEFIRTLNPYENLLRDEGAADPNADWRDLLRNYNFETIDDFDRVILDGVENGHMDKAAIRAEAEKQQQAYLQIDEDQSFSAAWDLYHDSFDDNAEEIVRKLIDSVRKAPRSVSPTNLSGTVTLLRDIGWKGDISGLIHEYIEKRPDGPEFWDIFNLPFGSNVTDKEVREAFQKKLSSFPEKRDAADILIKIGASSSWDANDLKFVADQGVDALYKIFKRLRGRDLRHAIKGALLFRGDKHDETMVLLTQRATEALQRIGAESPIYLRRVMQRGVAVPQGNGNNVASE